MIWGKDNVGATLGGNSNWIMGFNEPDSPSQSNLSPTEAAILWRQIEQTYPNRKLLSPATCGSPAGLNWLVDFRNAYFATYQTYPRLDGLAVHCYKWSAQDCITFVQSIIDQATAWGVPEVWVTEFSFATTYPSSQTGALQEQQTFINWMVAQPKITRYSWFASKIEGSEWWVITCYNGTKCFNNPLVDWNTSQPTSFGTVYQPYK
jgi:putative glycosyl hydrolase